MNLLDLLFPKSCLECGREGRYICDKCLNRVLDGTFDKNNFAIFKYKGVIRKAIVAIKYKFATDITDELVEISLKRLKSFKFHDICLAPIPLHIRRENWRGFNQSEILGKRLAEKMKWKFVPDLLIRQKKTAQQAELKGTSRKQNILGAFSVSSNFKLDKDYPILLFDDVYTTGSTINEARKVLVSAGFRKIYSLTIAR